MFEDLNEEERAELSYFLMEMAEAHMQMFYAVHGLRAALLRPSGDRLS